MRHIVLSIGVHPGGVVSPLRSGQSRNFRYASRARRTKVYSLSELSTFFTSYARSEGLPYAAATAVGYLRSVARQSTEQRRRRPQRANAENLGQKIAIPGAPRSWPNTLRDIAEHYQVLNSDPISSAELAASIRRLQVMASRTSQERPDGAHAKGTVVIPAYEDCRRVLACIESILSWPSKHRFEILIADDCSPSVRLDALGSIPGVRVTRNESNLGYVRSVNRAVSSASTPYVITLNQDTLVAPGCLDILIDALDNDSSLGAVGPRILGVDHRLLEAGGILWADGSAWNCGRDRDPTDSQCNYARDVDYVSGCCMAIRMEAWNSLGGLDEAFAPAYCDDSDLCLRMWSNGLRVRYLPSAVILHEEGTAMGRDESDQGTLKSHQVMNLQHLFARHTSQMSSFRQDSRAVTLLTHQSTRPIIACFHAHIPDPTQDAGSVDADLIMRYLNELGYQVVAIFPDEPPEESTDRWRARGIACSWLNDLNCRSWLSQAVALFTFQISSGPYFGRLQQDLVRARHIHHTGDVATLRLRTRNLANAAKPLGPGSRMWHHGFPTDPDEMWRLERKWLQKSDVALFVTQHDLDFAVQHGLNNQAGLFPICRGFEKRVERSSPPDGARVGFIGGMTHSPNVDAVQHFLDEVWPLVLKRVPHARFEVWGSGITPQFTAAWSAQDGVDVRGWFEDEGEVLDRLRLMVAPLRFGAGMKTKVVSALVRGTPVVGTSVAFQGLESVATVAALSHDAPEDLADRMAVLLTDDVAWSAVNRAELEFSGGLWTLDAERQRLNQLLQDLKLDVTPG